MNETLSQTDEELLSMADEEAVTISECVRANLDKFFHDMDGEDALSVYDMVMSAVERPMLEVVMTKANCNQTVASQMLGINRNTLRKKLQQHGMI